MTLLKSDPLPSAAPSAPAAPRFYVPALDGLRVFAFLAVWCVHALGPLLPLPGTPRASWATAFAWTGVYGVPVFFVLSAFLITRLLLLERERNGRVDLRAYYVRRTLRIWPLYFLVVAAGLAIKALQGQPAYGDALGLVTFTANYAKSVPHLLSPLWSVSVEEQFYLVWPLVLAFVPTRRLPGLCGAMIAAAFVARVASARYGVNWWGATTSHLDSLALGTLLALNFHRLPSLSPVRWGALSALCVLGMVLQMYVCPAGPSLRTAVSYAAVPFLCAALVGLAVGSKGTFLARPKLAAAGRLTFGLYCWHLFALALVRPTTPVGLLACLLGTWAVAAVSYYAYERPFLSLKHRFERVQTRPA